MSTDLKPVGADGDRDLSPGQQVGEYLIEEKIGQGGFGTVFRASHPLIGKLGAVKVLSRQYSADPEMVSRFIAEARAVNQIRHRNIIDIFGFGQLEDGRSYYVMEFLEGGPLDRHIEATGGVPAGEAIPILRAIARALDAAHAKGIAHRDLKPENIFLAREADGTLFPKLLDFGIAKLLGASAPDAKHKTRTGAPIGTPYYMSPEQCRGKDVDHRTDIYAFGCVSYELLTGKVPFEGDDYLSILFKQTSEQAVPPSVRVLENPILPPLPSSIDEVIAWLMKKEPAERPADLATAMRAIEDAVIAAGVEVAPDAPRSPLRTPWPMRAASGSELDAVRGRVLTPIEGAPTITPSSSDLLAVPAHTLEDKPSRRRLVLAGALVGAIALGAVAFVAVRSKRDVEPPPPQPAVSTQPAVTLAPPKSRLVTIRIDGAPEGTEVFGPSGPLGRAPGEIQLLRGDGEVQLTLQADGFESTITRVTPSKDHAITVALDAKPSPAPVVVEPPTTARAKRKAKSKTAVKRSVKRRPAKPEVEPEVKPAKPPPKPVFDPYSRK